MIKLVTAQEMQNLDKQACEEYEIPGLILMDQAAKAVADAALQQLQTIEGKIPKVVIFCGKGNNGGDGFGAARYLYNAGVKVEVFLVNATLNDIKGDAAQEVAMLRKAGVDVKLLLREEDLQLAEVMCLRADLIIDAMLGTGFSGELKGLYKDICHMLNSLKQTVLAVDIPTGVNADLSTRAEDAVMADITVTMALPKTGLLLYPGKENVGKLVLADIGMPKKLFDSCPSKKYLIEAKDVRAMLPKRPANAHKGDAGRVLITAGSPGYVGAAAMCGWSTVKSGAGLVSLLTPLSCREVLAVKLTEVMVHGLLERMPGILGSAATGDILQRAAKSDVLAIGPGLGTSESTLQSVLEVLQKVEVPVVIDADALTALKGHLDVLPKMKAPKVLTPHPGEMSRLTGVAIDVLDRERVKAVSHYAQEWKAVVVLKGAPTTIGLPDGTVYVNPTGCSAMATGGSGDVLTGIIAAYIASGMEPAKATLCAVYMHGLSGELASNGAVGLAATEIADAMPKVHNYIYNEEKNKFSIYNSSLQMVK